VSAYVGALLATAVFVLVFRVGGILPRSKGALGVASQAMRDMRSDLGDDAKESLMQGYARDLAGTFVALALIGALALGAPLGAVWLLDRAGVLSLEATLTVLMSWRFLTLVTAGVTAIVFAGRRMRPGT
jgi:hypothetical protein